MKAPPGSLVIVADVFCPIGSSCGAITAGDSVPFIAYRIADDGTAEEVRNPSWQVSDTTIALVSRSGWVRGRKPGQVRLSASRGPASADTLLTVLEARIVGVRVTAASSTLPVGESTQLTATLIDVLGQEHPGEGITWFVHNPTLASVDDQGLVRGLVDGHVVVSGFGPALSGGWISLQVGSGVPPIAGLGLAVASVGAHHTCGVAPTGEAYCWGWNYYGQLGQGHFSEPEETFGTPLRLPGSAAFRAVSGGSYHTCALLTNDRPYCWGANMSGQLGSGAIGGATPSPVAVEGEATYRSISAGGDHTCGLRTDGAALCWGGNYLGQLGNGTTEAVGTPTPVAGRVDFTALRAGLWHTCGLDARDAAYCWGDNSLGQLGNGRLGANAARAVPTAVRSPVRFVALETSAAASHTCGLTESGEAFCWGRNDSGQLGDGTSEPQRRPVRVNTALSFTAIAPGSHHTCALTAVGAVHCWGNNDDGQLGDNSLHSRSAPASPVATALRFVSLTATNNTTCGRTTSGETYCWGANAYAQLGAGFMGPGTLSAMPLPVARP